VFKPQIVPAVALKQENKSLTRQFWSYEIVGAFNCVLIILADLIITACTRVPPAALKKKKSHNPQATSQNKSENCGPTTRQNDSAAVGRIKGIPNHPPEGSCSGYPLIPYSAASDACSRRCVNPAAK
jgi:hypothetical protein